MYAKIEKFYYFNNVLYPATDSLTVAFIFRMKGCIDHE